MVKQLVHDPELLSIPSAPAEVRDLSTALDLMDTLRFRKKNCLGMAANMIGVNKRIIVFLLGDEVMVMLNPECVSLHGKRFETKESCLSLLGGPRPVTRYEKITVRWQNLAFHPRTRTFTGLTAQVIQHELDHCDGILI